MLAKDRALGDSHQLRNSYGQKEPLASHNPQFESGTTFAAQEHLPKLPIPNLESTCKKYLDALKPLQDRREQELTATAVGEFLKSDGPDLQGKLTRYASVRTNYLEQFCMLLFL